MHNISNCYGGDLYEDSCLCHRTRMASRAVTRFYDETLRSVGLRATQLAVLVAVDNEDVMSIEGGGNLRTSGERRLPGAPVCQLV